MPVAPCRGGSRAGEAAILTARRPLPTDVDAEAAARATPAARVRHARGHRSIPACRRIIRWSPARPPAARAIAVRCRAHRRVGSGDRIEAAGHSRSGRRQARFHRRRTPRRAGRRCLADDRKITRAGAYQHSQPKKLTERLRTLAVAAAVVVIVVGGFHIISRLFEDGGPARRRRPSRAAARATEPQRSRPTTAVHRGRKPPAAASAAPQRNRRRSSTPSRRPMLASLPAPIPAGATPAPASSAAAAGQQSSLDRRWPRQPRRQGRRAGRSARGRRADRYHRLAAEASTQRGVAGNRRAAATSCRWRSAGRRCGSLPSPAIRRRLRGGRALRRGPRRSGQQ